MRIHVEKNSKGYNQDTTYEITTDDPDLDLAAEMEAGIQDADRVARAEVANRQYTDVEGLPGSDDTP